MAETIRDTMVTLSRKVVEERDRKKPEEKDYREIRFDSIGRNVVSIPLFSRELRVTNALFE